MSAYVVPIGPAPSGPSSIVISPTDRGETEIFVLGVEEARLARRKRVPGTFPRRAIRACLDYGGLTLSDVGRILLPRTRPIGCDAEIGTRRIAARLSRPGEHVPPIGTYNHYRCHAASAYLPSGYDDALVENLFWILRSMWTLRSRFCVGQAQLTEEFPTVIRMVFDIELLFEEMLNLLEFPGLAVSKHL